MMVLYEMQGTSSIAPLSMVFRRVFADMQRNFNKLKPQTGLLAFFIYFALAASVILVFQQVRNFDFVNLDDGGYVYENQHVLNGLTGDGVIWAFTTGDEANWHPLTWLSLMLDCELFGPDPGRIHLVNVLLHLANTLLLFAILKKITGSLWPSAFVAAAFAIHPMHVESVAWIAERKDVLSTFFFLLTLAAYAGYVKRPSIFRYFAALTIFALGLMAKPMLVTLPFVLLLLDYWPLNRFEVSVPVKKTGRQTCKSAPAANKHSTLYRLIIEKIPFFALAAVSSIITFIVQRNSGAMMNTYILSLAERCANALLSYARYTGKLFWPRNLAVFYPFDAGGIPAGLLALSVLLLAGVTFLAFGLGRSRKYLPVGWFWFVGTLIPVIGLVQVGLQSYADRYTYIPSIGLFILVAWGLPELLSKWPYRKAVLGVSMAVVLTAMGFCAHRQAGYWKDSVTLFSRALKVTQNNHVAYYNLGNAYGNLGRHQEAVEAYKQAIRFKPDHADAHINLGAAYGSLGRYQEAIEAYKQAIRFKPDDADAHYNLGAAYGNLSRYPEAIEAFKQAIRFKPDFAEAYTNLGAAYGDLGRYPEAIETSMQAISIKPDDVKAHNNLGVAYNSIGRYRDAIEAFKSAIKLKPDYIDAHLCLGVVYLKVNDKASALEEYEILKTLNAELAEKFFNMINK